MGASEELCAAADKSSKFLCWPCVKPVVTVAQCDGGLRGSGSEVTFSVTLTVTEHDFSFSTLVKSFSTL